MCLHIAELMEEGSINRKLSLLLLVEPIIEDEHIGS